jgi:hypothetical protein
MYVSKHGQQKRLGEILILVELILVLMQNKKLTIFITKIFIYYCGSLS